MSVDRLGRIAQLTGVNSIPVIGVLFGGWSDATALALYWCETVLLVVFMAVRIGIHRRATRKRGHYIEKRLRTSGRGTKPGGVGHFGTSFFFFGVIASLFNAVFLSWAVGDARLERIDVSQLENGVITAAALMAFGFLLDMPGISRRPFAWIKQMSKSILWRVFLVQFAMVAGLIVAAIFGVSRGTLFAFAALKLYTDIATQAAPVRAPIDPEQKKIAAQEEERFAGRPMPFTSALIQRVDGSVR